MLCITFVNHLGVIRKLFSGVVKWYQATKIYYLITHHNFSLTSTAMETIYCVLITYCVLIVLHLKNSYKSILSYVFLFSQFSVVYFEAFFYHFQPCKHMRKHAIVGQNTQQFTLGGATPLSHSAIWYLISTSSQPYCDSSPTGLIWNKVSAKLIWIPSGDVFKNRYLCSWNWVFYLNPPTDFMWELATCMSIFQFCSEQLCFQSF